MKKISLILVLSLVSLCVFSQKLEENKVDEFTKHSVKRTSWEHLVQNMKMNANVRVSKIDANSLFFEFKYFGSTVSIFSVKKGNNIMLKLDNDSIVTLQTIDDQISEKGAGAIGFGGSGAYGISLTCSVDKKSFEILSNHKVVKFRFYTNDGYIEEEVGPKKQDLISKEFQLVK